MEAGAWPALGATLDFHRGLLENARSEYNAEGAVHGCNFKT